MEIPRRTGNLVVIPFTNIFVAFVWLFRMIVKLLAKVTPAVCWIFDDFPVKILRVKDRIGVQDVEVLSQGLGRDEIGRVDVGMRQAE